MNSCQPCSPLHSPILDPTEHLTLETKEQSLPGHEQHLSTPGISPPSEIQSPLQANFPISTTTHGQQQDQTAVPQGSPPPPMATSSNTRTEQFSQIHQLMIKQPGQNSSGIPENDLDVNKYDESDMSSENQSDEEETYNDILTQHSVFGETKPCSENLPYPCDQCDKCFSSMKEYMNHVRSTHNGEPICKICDRTFKDLKSMRNHKRKHHFVKTGSSDLVCKTCGKGFKIKEQLKFHCNFVHEIEEVNPCNLCGKRCQNKLKLWRHVRECLLKDPEVVAQDRLYFDAVEKKRQEQHQLQAKDSGNLTVNKFQTPNNEQEYNDSYSPEQEYNDVPRPDYKDDIKKEGTAEVDIMENAVKIETEPDISEILNGAKKLKKKYVYPIVAKVCPICAKEVKYLNEHIKSLHTETDEIHICNQCGKVCGKLRQLRDHLDSTHKNEPSLCDICSKVFKNARSLRNHKKKVHEDVGEVNCPSCSKVFDTKAKLYNHEKAVHLIENSMCQACGKTYKNRSLLKKHLKVYHNELYEALQQKKYFDERQQTIE